MSKKVDKSLGSDLGHSTVVKALHGADPEQNASLFLRLHAGLSTSSIWNTSSFLRPHAATIHKSNPEHLLVLKAPLGDNPQVQFGTPCF